MLISACKLDANTNFQTEAETFQDKKSATGDPPFH